MANINTFSVGDYDIVKKRIGRGAFSNIYKAYHQYNKKVVAVKEISLDTLNKYEKMIKKETHIMKKLNHPNIIKLYDTIIDSNTENVYLVMEYFSRGDFAKFLNKRPLKEKYAIKYLKQIADAMKYLLDNKIIHRDLKPQNILVSETGSIKISDFGFARYFDSDIMIQTICGSPLYMAPEIIKNKKYDYKSDLWSIGIILYEMLVGKPPFRAKNIYELIRVLENDSIKLPKNISDNCKNLLNGLLNKNPDERISWEDFFNHSILIDKKSNPLKEENDLMEISNLDNFPVIPSVKNDFFSDSFFSKKNNFITSNNNSSFYSKDSDIDLNLEFNFDLKNDSNMEESNALDVETEESDVYYDSVEYQNDEESICAKNNFIKIKNNNSIVKDFVVIKRINANKKNNFSRSLANYLSGSISFIKESYSYFKNYNSI